MSHIEASFNRSFRCAPQPDARQIKSAGAFGFSGLSALLAAGMLLIAAPARGATARAHNHVGDNRPEHAIDGNVGNQPLWAGSGAPNWLEIKLPAEEEIARVAVYPGDLRFASLPSTECSPAAFTVQEYRDGEWRDASETVRPRPYAQRRRVEEHFAAVDFDPPLRTDRFRVYIHELQDEGHRVRGDVLPPDQRVVKIREVRWYTPREISAERATVETAVESALREIDRWEQWLGAPRPDAELAAALRSRYLPELGEARETFMPGKDGAWQRLRAGLRPWEDLLREDADSRLESRHAPREPALLVEVDPGGLRRSFYPVRLPLDLGLLQEYWDVPLDAHNIRVVPYDREQGAMMPFLESARGCIGIGAGPRYSPSRLDRSTPERGVLTWSMRDASQNNFMILFGRDETGDGRQYRDIATIGDGDHLYYDEVVETAFPEAASSMAFVDWFGDGRPHLLIGTRNRGVYIWRNSGGRDQMEFGHDYFEVVDSAGNMITTHPQRPDFGMNIVSPADVTGNGRIDFFLQSILNDRPRIRFYENMGPDDFPVMKPARAVSGLAAGLTAFGDLNGNGKIDAVQAVNDGSRIVFEMRRGLPLDENGMPRFEAEGRRVALGGRDFSVSRGRLHPALADLNGNGLPDLSFYASDKGHFYVAENIGDRGAPRWAAPYRIKRGENHLVSTPYAGREALMWGDATGNGVPDLIVTGGRIWERAGDPRGPVRVGRRVEPRLSVRKVLSDFWGTGFDYADWTGNGFLDKVQVSRSGSFRLLVRQFEDGLFREDINIPLDERSDWYGCPDRGEYGILYPNIVLADITGNGLDDVFLATEHSWRFGYVHWYENLGGGEFGPQRKLRPGGTHDYVDYVPGKEGLAARVTGETMLDYLSYPTAGNFDPAGGTLSFWFKPDWDAGSGERAYFFHTEPSPLRNLNSRDLTRYYQRTHEGLSIDPGFALFKDRDDALRLQLWEREVATRPLDWQSGAWYRIEVSWGPDGVSLKVNGSRLARQETPVAAGEAGARMHIGSRSVRFVQPLREYDSRSVNHPSGWIYPANGVIDQLQITDDGGRSLLSLSFDGHTDGADGEDGRRLRVGYRCSPGFADLTGNGLLDMVIMVNDGHRQTKGVLQLFPNRGTREQPDFGEGKVLRYADGSPLEASVRSHLSLVDWTGNGLTDIILANHGGSVSEARPTVGVQLFRNVGRANEPAFAPGERFHKVHDAFHISHDPRAVAADFTGDGDLDLVVSSDPGIFFFSRSYLDEDPPRVLIRGESPGASGP